MAKVNRAFGCRLCSVGLTAEITKEISEAMRKLGGQPETVELTDTYHVNRALEFLGADIYLLCAVGSWGDTTSDEETLRDLKCWNAGGSLRADISFINK